MAQRMTETVNTLAAAVRQGGRVVAWVMSRMRTMPRHFGAILGADLALIEHSSPRSASKRPKYVRTASEQPHVRETHIRDGGAGQEEPPSGPHQMKSFQFVLW